MNSKAKSLITGQPEQLTEAPEGMPPGGGGGAPQRGPGGPPRRGPGGPPRRPGGPGGPGNGVDPGVLKDLIILDLLQALGNDPFFTMIANVALKGEPITPEVVRHLMDEAPKYADKMSPEVNELMGKIAQMPMQ
jgi:hypothetical protein